MRARLALAILVLLVGFPVQAQKAPPPTAPAQAAKPAATPAPAPSLAPTVTTPIPYGIPPAPPRSPLPGAAADAAQAQCSAACSRTYYQCLAGDNADLCSGDWAQCRVRCGNTARRAGG
jgi:hypothetical protein